MSSNVPSTIALPNQNESFCAFGDTITVLLTGAQTGGKLTMFLDITPPGGGPPPHYHTSEDEWFHVLEGRASFFNNGKWTEVPAGTTVFIPKGTVHSFKNVGDTPLKQIIQTSPSGFERFFARCAEEFKNPAGPNMDQILKISAEHGIHFVQ